MGHVPDKVDRETSDALSFAIDQVWGRWSSDRDARSLFWDFIETERNLVLKEYERRFLMGEHMIVARPPDGEETHVVDSELYIPMVDGAFAGQDAREVVRDAMNWWERELNLIESSSRGEDFG